MVPGRIYLRMKLILSKFNQDVHETRKKKKKEREREREGERRTQNRANENDTDITESVQGRVEGTDSCRISRANFGPGLHRTFSWGQQSYQAHLDRLLGPSHV